MDWFELVSDVPGTLFLLAAATATELAVPRERHSLRSRLVGVQITIVSIIAAAICLQGLSWLWKHIGVEPVLSVPDLSSAVLAILASIVFLDFIAYWLHRFQHLFIWRIHAVHHSPTELNAVTGYAHFLEKGFDFLLFGIPLSLIDFGWLGIPAMILVGFKAMQNYIHSPVTTHLGVLSRVLVDNQYHRIHHSMEGRHFDKNFGILFSFWDALFGTAYWPAKDEWPPTGVAGTPPPTGIVDYIFMPLRVRSNLVSPVLPGDVRPAPVDE